MDIVLEAQAPFSLPAVVRSHGWVQLAPFSSSDPYHDFRYVDRLQSGRVVTWDVQPCDGGALLSVGGELSSAEQRETEDKARWCWGWTRIWPLLRRRPPGTQAGEGRRTPPVVSCARPPCLRIP